MEGTGGATLAGATLAQPTTLARATLPAPWQNNRVLWQGACGSFIEKEEEASQACEEDQVVWEGRQVGDMAPRLGQPWRAQQPV